MNYEFSTQNLQTEYPKSTLGPSTKISVTSPYRKVIRQDVSRSHQEIPEATAALRVAYGDERRRLLRCGDAEAKWNGGNFAINLSRFAVDRPL